MRDITSPGPSLIRNAGLVLALVLALQPLFLLALIVTDYIAPAERRAASMISPIPKIDRAGEDTVECAALAIGLEPGSAGLTNAIRAARPLIEDPSRIASTNGNPVCDALFAAASGKDGLYWWPYPRYWHGYRVVLDPLTAWMSIYKIRYLMLAALVAALAWFGFEFREIAGYPAAVALMVPTVVLTDLWRIWQYTAPCMSTLVIFAGGAIFARKLRGGSSAIATAAVLGSVFNYVDFLTNPPWQPMLIAFVALAARRGWRDVLLILTAWSAGYAITWASKWAIACAWGLPWAEIADVILFRLNGDASIVNHRLLAPSGAVLSYLYHQTAAVITVLILLPIILLPLRKPRWRTFLLTSWPAAIPFFWFELLSNHTQIHYWIAYRPVASAIGILLAALLIEDRRIQDADC